MAKALGRARDVAAIRRAVVRGRFSVVFVNTGHDWSTLTRDVALLSALPRRSVSVLQFHGSQSGRLVAPGSRAFKLATATLLARADGLLVLSQEECAQLRHFKPSSRVFVVRYPRQEWSDVPGPPSMGADERKVILGVSRLIESKGIFELVQALPLVQEVVPSRLVLAGDGPERARIRALVTELGLTESVELTGYVEGAALARLYASAAVFALPTTHDEGFPTVILEAMAAGLPIVTTRTRGPVDHLVEGTHVFFTPPRDPHALAEQLIRILADSDLGTRLGEANRLKVQEFDAEQVAKEYLSAFEAIARNARSRA